MSSFKYAQIEYERRFLLTHLPPDVSPKQYTIITDVYIPDTRLRLRQITSPDGEVLALKMTQKYSEPDYPATQTIITNIYLNEVEFAKLKGVNGRLLTKHRYTYHHAGYRWSLDVFQEPLHGLILAEIEARSAEELAQIPVPSFAVTEVTAEPHFTGGVLVQATNETITALLADV